MSSTRSFRSGVSPGGALALVVGWMIVVALLAAGMVAIAGVASAEEITNETVTLDESTEPIVVGVEWNDSITDPSTATATVEIYNESAYSASVDAPDTLNGTVLELNESDVFVDATYSVDLEGSTGAPFEVGGDEFGADGSVDLTTIDDYDSGSDSITADDTVTGVDVTADTLLTDSIDADEGNTTEREYNATDANALENGEEYRVLIDATESEVDDAWIEDSAAAPIIGGEGGAAVGVGVVLLVLGAFVYVGRAD